MRDRWVLFWHIFGFTAFFALIALLIGALVSPRNTRVPTVTGMPEGAAQTVLADASLRVGNVSRVCSDTVAAGLVISQDPPANARVRRNSTVDLTVSTGPCTVAVPDLTGLSRADAETVLAAAGLGVGPVTELCSDTVAAGFVIGQSPAGGTRVQPGSAVLLQVSSGPCPPVSIAVPNVTGTEQADAVAAILGVGLSVGNITEACSDTVPAGNVVSQSPEGGAMVQPGTGVDLVVSSGPCPVAVPDVTGMMQSEAEQSIVSAGLAVGEVTQACSDTVPAGNVASQSPEGGAMVQPGTAVDLVVSTGQPTVPDVTGLAEPDALSAILAVPGLGVSVTLQCSDTVAAGLVAGQSVSGGTVAACGTVVILTVSTGVCPVAVPDVTGLTLEAAGLALEQASLLYTTLEDCSDTTPAGSVAAQAPEPGSLVPPASTVALVVSTGPCPVTVPNVLGLEEDAALAALREASLLYEVLQDCSDTVPAGQVAAQDPAGGAVVPPGTTVTVTVSVGMCVTVPDVTGLPVLNAALQLDEAGLTLGTRTDDCDGSVPQGQVRAQDPAAGSRVLAGTAVNISVSTGPCPPDNDLCENAYPLITGVETYGNLFNATPTEGVSWDFADIYDVWYSWTPETSGNAVITTCGPGTTFDTVLRVFDNCNDLTQLTSNEDSDQCDENPTHSRLTYPVTAGNTYLIRVSGYAQTVGQFQVQAYMEGGL